ncbi:MAG: hypothetical protein KKE64_04390 [Candidatus Omnitrophica bacterium]|nr:hypothetical protein [Candidatus Omnitrophota bacterium]
MKSKRLLILVIILIAVIALAGVLWYGNRPVNDQPEPKPNDNKTATTTEEVIDTEEDIDTSDWQTYRNIIYNYELKYPKEGDIGYYPALKVEEVSSLTIFVGKTPELDVSSYDPSSITIEDGLREEAIRIMNLDLEDYVNYVWNLNKNDIRPGKEVGEIIEFEINKEKTYKFKIAGSYKDERGGFLVHGQEWFVFVERGKNRYELRIKDDNISKKIFESFRFTD